MNAPTAPLVGITGRRKTATIMGAPAGFADAPLDVYLSEYASSITRAGGVPVHLTQDAPAAALIGHLDALLIAGGDDVDPRRYGETPGAHTTTLDPARDAFETGLIEAAFDADVPVLGVCRGHQLLNVVRGGSLRQHLPAGDGESHGVLAYPRAHRTHDVDITGDGVLARVYPSLMRVNSFHHQAVGRLGDGVVVTAVAPDGVIEGIEITGHRAVGVQWHPEVWEADPIFEWLIDAARTTPQDRK